MDREYALKLLTKTKDDYNNIAELFSRTRSYLPNDIIALKEYAKPKENILDLGCGNGRLVDLFEGMNISYTGADDSKELVRIAKKNHPANDFVVVDPLKLEFSDNEFDTVFCLSVFHHIPSTELRLEYLKEIWRVIKPGGTLILTVWNMWRKPGMYLRIILDGIMHPKLDLDDTFYPFKDGSGKVLANRYIHCFHEDELIKLLMEAGFEVSLVDFQKRGKKEENENILVISKK